MNQIYNLLVISFFVLIRMTAFAKEPMKNSPQISAGVSAIKTFQIDGGNVAFEDSGSGSPVILCIPGMGDTRGQYRLLAPRLVRAGYRVIIVDPRGQGDSDATFQKYSASSVGYDLVQLIDTWGKNVYLVGNSSGGASAAWVAANRPKQVLGLVLLDAFLRDHPVSFLNHLLLHLGLSGPWGASMWINYYKSLFVTHPPIDQDTYTASLKEALKQIGHMDALKQMVFASKSDVEKRLSEVQAPVLAIAGSKDPDFKDPNEELSWILTQVHGEKSLIEGAGHYPHLEYPDQVLALMVDFIQRHHL